MRSFGYRPLLLFSMLVLAACGESRSGKVNGDLDFCVMDSSFSISVGDTVSNCKASYALSVVSYEIQRLEDSEILKLYLDDHQRAGFARFLAENNKRRAVISIGKVAVRKVMIFGSDTGALELRFDSAKDVQDFLTKLRESGG